VPNHHASVSGGGGGEAEIRITLGRNQPLSAEEEEEEEEEEKTWCLREEEVFLNMQLEEEEARRRRRLEEQRCPVCSHWQQPLQFRPVPAVEIWLDFGPGRFASRFENLRDGIRTLKDYTAYMICVVQEKSALQVCDAFQEFQDRLRAMSELKMNLENALRRLLDDSHSLRGLHERRRLQAEMVDSDIRTRVCRQLIITSNQVGTLVSRQFS
jgi:hypothetical protein